MMSSNILFCPQPKNIEFTVIKEPGKQKIFSFSKAYTPPIMQQIAITPRIRQKVPQVIVLLNSTCRIQPNIHL